MRVKPKNKAVKGSGDLKDRITFITHTETTGDAGEITTERVVVKTVWADVQPMTGKRALEFGQIVGNNPYVIHTRKESIAVDNDYLIEYGDKFLTIHSAVEIEDSFETIAYEKA